ncbi:hypothetical protein [Pseudarthrobacter sp. lyk4-40-TYG-27]|uniref:hypothetical protein n=1 Tax=Pseudarthrobacter sp. lyk4-40-TYG-27 TaxID=3040305 RepID=UPI0025576EC2|nr:hypothetical protein [Pseudarthrobacter sp. lyk4-40-TYG-27]
MSLWHFSEGMTKGAKNVGGRQNYEVAITGQVTSLVPILPPIQAPGRAGRRDWLKKQKSVWWPLTREKGVVPVSGKSKGGAAKKVGKSILEKRAEKKAKTESSELHVIKQRKNHR